MDKEISDQQPATSENREQNIQEATKKASTPSLAEQVRTNPEIQRELDQRITQAITTAKAKWDEEAKLSGDEKSAKARAVSGDITIANYDSLIGKLNDEDYEPNMPTMAYPTASITSTRRRRSFPRSMPATVSPWTYGEFLALAKA